MVKKSHGKQKALWPKTYVNLGEEAIPHLVTRRRGEGAGGGAKIARKKLFFLRSHMLKNLKRVAFLWKTVSTCFYTTN